MSKYSCIYHPAGDLIYGCIQATVFATLLPGQMTDKTALLQGGISVTRTTSPSNTQNRCKEISRNGNRAIYRDICNY